MPATSLINRGFWFCVALAFFSGCTSAPPQKAEPAHDPVAGRIDKAVSSAAAERPVGANMAAPQARYSWKSTVTDYFGDASVFLRDVARGVGKRSEVSGPQPAIPIYIRIQARGEPLEVVLRRVAEQLGGRADIVLRDDAIVLRYRPV